MTRPKTRMLVDLRDLMKLIDPEREFHPSVIERWLARVYEKSYAIPCHARTGWVDLPYDRIWLELLKRERDEVINPLRYLPECGDCESLSFQIRDDILLIEDGYGIETDRRSLHPRHGRD